MERVGEESGYDSFEILVVIDGSNTHANFMQLFLYFVVLAVIFFFVLI